MSGNHRMSPAFPAVAGGRHTGLFLLPSLTSRVSSPLAPGCHTEAASKLSSLASPRRVSGSWMPLILPLAHLLRFCQRAAQPHWFLMVYFLPPQLPTAAAWTSYPLGTRLGSDSRAGLAAFWVPALLSPGTQAPPHIDASLSVSLLVLLEFALSSHFRPRSFCSELSISPQGGTAV